MGSREGGSVPSDSAPSPTPELLQPSCAGGPGVLSEQQVLGGLSWQEVRARHRQAAGQPQGRCSQWGTPTCTRPVCLEDGLPSPSLLGQGMVEPSLCALICSPPSAGTMEEPRWWMRSSCCVSAGPWRPLTWIRLSGESMSSPTPGPQPTWLPTQPFCSLTTDSWGWTCPMGASECGRGGRWACGQDGHGRRVIY